MNENKYAFDTKEYWEARARRLAAENVNLLITIQELSKMIYTLSQER